MEPLNQVFKLKGESFAGPFYFIAFLYIVIYSLSQINTILTSIAISILIWFLINSLASRLKRIPILKGKTGDYLAIPISLIIIFATLFQTTSFIASNIAELTASLNGLDTKVIATLEKFSATIGFDIKENYNSYFQEFSISSIINKIVGIFSTILGNAVQILLYVLFLLLDQQYFDMKMKALFPNENNRNKANHVLHSISENIKTYISITTIVSLATGVLTYLICEAFGLDGAGLWGFVAFILNFIPTIGSIIAVLTPFFFALVQLDLTTAILLIPALGIVQFSIGNILQPRLMGNKLNISQFVVILSLVVWGAMWGTIGMFLSVPLMVILMIIFSQFESTRALAILISGNGQLVEDRKDDEEIEEEKESEKKEKAV